MCSVCSFWLLQPQQEVSDEHSAHLCPPGTGRSRHYPAAPLGVPAVGPTIVKFEEGWEKEFTQIQGGPGKVRVARVGKPNRGIKWVNLECEGMTAKMQARIVCSSD